MYVAPQLSIISFLATLEKNRNLQSERLPSFWAQTCALANDGAWQLIHYEADSKHNQKKKGKERKTTTGPA